MPLDKDMEDILERMARAKAPEYPEMGAVLAREFVDCNLPVIDIPPEAVHHIEDIKITGWQDDQIDARLYWPHEPNWSQPTPVMLWFHGGGFTVGSIASYDAICRMLCARANVVVLSVAYRLAPEYKFPTAAMDAFHAYQWLLAHGSEYGLSTHNTIIGGDSAGGTLTAAVCLMARDYGLPQPRLQMLIYPGTCGFGETPAYQQYAYGYKLTKPVIDWFFGHYLNDDGDRRDIRFAPLYADSHADLAPAWIAIAEYDPLADDGRLYAEQLSNDGVPTQLVEYSGVIHGFLTMGGVIARSHQLHRDMVARIGLALGQSGL